MATTFTKIATVDVGLLGASSIDFTSIPATYTDLVIKLSGRSSRVNSEDYLKVAFNSDTTNGNYTGRFLYGTGSGTGSETFTSAGTDRFVGNSNGTTTTSNTFSNLEVYIPNYAGSTSKSYATDSVLENNATSAPIQLIAGRWSGTSAITSISIATAFGSFVQYSTATLYGVSNA